jgi:hypothetical protein
MPCVHRDPIPGELWLSRPPYLLVAHVLEARSGTSPIIAYEILDDDGSVLAGPIHEPLDDSWSRNFQPIERRYG